MHYTSNRNPSQCIAVHISGGLLLRAITRPPGQQRVNPFGGCVFHETKRSLIMGKFCSHKLLLPVRRQVKYQQIEWLENHSPNSIGERLNILWVWSFALIPWGCRNDSIHHVYTKQARWPSCPTLILHTLHEMAPKYYHLWLLKDLIVPWAPGSRNINSTPKKGPVCRI